MQALTEGQVSAIKVMYGADEFIRFKKTLLLIVDEYNSSPGTTDSFDHSAVNVVDAEQGEIKFSGYCFQFALEEGDENAPRADITYRFITDHSQVSGTKDEHDGHADIDGNAVKGGNGAQQVGQTGRTQGDPRNTPLMRYQADILGTGIQPGDFDFYWDGETTTELAESLLEEFIQWISLDV